MSSADNTGLRLFDDTASAAGSFPTALRGYERSAVDDYVRSLEGSVVAIRRHAQELLEQVERLQQQSEEERRSEAQELDYSGLGGRASDILRLAQEQAHDLTENAAAEAARTREVARREADAIRRDAAQHSEQLRAGGAAHIDQLRSRLQEDLQAQVARVQADSEALLAAARRQAEALTRQAEHEAQTVRQAAFLDTENLRRRVEREAAEVRQEIAASRERAVADLAAVHEQAESETGRLLQEATAFHAEAAARLEADLADSARIRAEALTEAEEVKVAAAQEAEAQRSGVQQEVAALRERSRQEFSWRRQQLRRETELLSQRKQAVLGQLASLSALAQQTAQTFPDVDELEDADTLAQQVRDERAEGEDPTEERPGVRGGPMAPAAAGGSPDGEGARADVLDPAAADLAAQDAGAPGHRPPAVDEVEDATVMLVLDEPDVDGDATILISTADLPGDGEQPRDPAARPEDEH